MTSPDLEYIESFVLGLTESNMSVVTEIISEGNKVSITLNGSVHWTTNITKDSAKDLWGSLLSNLWYCIPGLLSLTARRAKFTSVPNYLHTGSGLGLHHPQDDVLTDMTKAMVP